VGWTTFPSDKRFKTNITENVKGLDFIMRLRPVTYNVRVNEIAKFLGEDKKIDKSGHFADRQPGEFEIRSRDEKSKIVCSGFIGQEVEKAANDAGYNFSGIDPPKSDKGMYGLRYAEFVVPLVKAVQEMKAENDALKVENDEIKVRLNALEALIKKQ